MWRTGVNSTVCGGQMATLTTCGGQMATPTVCGGQVATRSTRKSKDLFVSPGQDNVVKK